MMFRVTQTWNLVLVVRSVFIAISIDICNKNDDWSGNVSAETAEGLKERNELMAAGLAGHPAQRTLTHRFLRHIGKTQSMMK